MFDYHEAIREMHKGNVIKYVGTVNGNVMIDKGMSFCMQRGVVFVYNGRIIPHSEGNMVYDPDFRYVLTGETINPRGWINSREMKSELGYSRIGLGNV